MALNQFKRLPTFIQIRDQNRNRIIQNLKNHKNWKNQFTFVGIDKDIKPSWFGLPILINDKYAHIKKVFLKHLTKKGIENRPIISGNFLNQPASKLYKFKYKRDDFINSEKIERQGFFIGLHTQKITTQNVNMITENLLSINKFI